MLGRALALVALALLQVPLLAGAAEAATVRITGSTTVAGLLQPKQPEVETKSGLTIEIEGVGSSRGIEALIAGEADVAMISASLEQVVVKLNQKAPGSVDGSSLVSHPVGATEVAFAVHPSNPVTQLTLAQITEVLAGRITNWSQLGGQDARIDVAISHQGDGIRTMVEKELLGGASVSGKPRQLRFATQIPQVVAAVPNAFGLTTASRIGAGITPVRTDSQITQPLLFVTQGPASPEVAALIDVVRAALGN